MTTIENVTIRQLRALREEAYLAGDKVQVAICEAALAGDEGAVSVCVDAINEAEARNDELV